MEQKRFSVLQSRRQFIRQAACAALGTAGLTCTIRDLRFMNAAVAQSSIADYKALVCIFLGGGNDSNNLIVPTLTSEYNNYAAIRTPILALPQSSLLGITPLNSDGHSYGLHPCLPELQTLFGEGKLAILFNTGTLVFPITRAQYLSGILERPPQLFSHADQVTQWQTSIPDQPPLTGWGGRCADLLNSIQPNPPISLSVSLAGANTFEVGNVVSQYSVSTSGAVALSGLTPGTARFGTLTNILGLANANMQARAYAGVATHSINTASVLNNAIAATADPSSTQQYWTVPFPGSYPFPVTTPTSRLQFSSSLGPQLKMVARLIEAGHRAATSGGFGMKRQIFFCSVGGYDLHTNQTPGPGQTLVGSHANLLAELSQCMFAFQRAMEQLGLANNITAFTASDFSRTFPSNGQGSDHGWGSHHLILGGAVKGQRTYGALPTLAVNGPDDTGTGRWIPTIAIDQYFSTLATWFGVDAAHLGSVFPNLSRFPTSNLGFI
jgi:uncharacterized protein (DUF1501 family)